MIDWESRMDTILPFYDRRKRKRKRKRKRNVQLGWAGLGWIKK